MKIAKRIAIVLVSLALILIVVGLFLPASYHAERSIVINAPASVVFDYVNDLTKWEEWGPWQEEDPTIEITYGDQ
ncbi:MAG: polyketide cyclase, partial [Calditrichaeota bacterium]